MTRADAWILFAAAAIPVAGNERDACSWAAVMLKEFDKRFEPTGKDKLFVPRKDKHDDR